MGPNTSKNCTKLIKTFKVSKKIEKPGEFNVSEDNLRKIIQLCEEYKYHKTNANDIFSERVDNILNQILEEES